MRSRRTRAALLPAVTAALLALALLPTAARGAARAPAAGSATGSHTTATSASGTTRTTGTAGTALAPLAVTISVMTPVSAADGATLTLRGTVANTGASAATDLQLVLGVGSPPSARVGLLRDFSTPALIARVLDDCAASCLGGTLTPGASEAFALSLPLGNQLDRGVVSVYPVVLRVIGDDVDGTDTDTDGVDGSTLGEADSFLPYVPDHVGTPLRVSWLVPLDPPPADDAHGAIATTTFPASIDAGGSVARLLSDSDRPGEAPVTYAVEPSLLTAAAQTARTGWTRSGDPATRTPRAADPGSATFLTTLAAATRGRDVLALPYADPDAEAVTRAGLGLDLSGAIATGRSDLSAALPAARVLSGFGWLPGDAVDQATLDTYAAAGVSALVLPGGQFAVPATAFPPTQTAVSTLTTSGPSLEGLLADPDVETLLAAAGHDAPSARMSAQRLLALLALTVGEAPNDPDSRDMILALPRGTVPVAGWLTDVLHDTGSVPWLSAVPLGATADDTAAPRQPLAPYPATARAAELPQQALAAGPNSTAAVRRRVDALASAATETAITRPLDLALARTESYAWRADPAGGAALRNGVAAQTAALLAQIRLAAATTVTLASHNAQIPVTVDNSLPEPVTVRVTLFATDRTKLVTTSTVVSVAANHKQRVLLAAHTQRAGTFRAEITLTTPSGQTIVDVPVTVHSRAYGAVTLGITLGALAVLLLAIVVRTVRRLRRRPHGGGGSADGEPTPPTAPAGALEHRASA
jgi:hypothetical protein